MDNEDGCDDVRWRTLSVEETYDSDAEVEIESTNRKSQLARSHATTGQKRQPVYVCNRQLALLNRWMTQ